MINIENIVMDGYYKIRSTLLKNFYKQFFRKIRESHEYTSEQIESMEKFFQEATDLV